MPADLKSKNKVEIFSAGTWNGDPYSIEDLDEMVRAFEEQQETLRPFLKLGHDEKQKLLQADGLPAAGWVGKVYRIGTKLYADFVDIPQKIYDLLELKAYRKVSSEIYLNVKILDKTYKYMLGAVALLGADTPGVMNLNDILAMYGLKDYDSIKSYASENKITSKLYSFNNQEFKESLMSKTEREIELEQKLKLQEDQSKALEAEKKKFQADLDAANKAKEDLEKKNKENEQKVFAAEKAAKEAEIEKQADSLISEKLASKSMRPYIVALLKDEPESKKYSIKVEDKNTEMTKADLIKEMAKLFKKLSDVNFEESSLDGEQKSRKDEVTQEDVEKYATENKLSFSDAYKKLLYSKAKMSTQTVSEEV